MKRCKKCGEEKPLAGFNRNRSLPDGFAGACKVCRNAGYRERYSRCPDKALARAKRWYQNNPESVLAVRARQAPRKRETGRLWDKRNPEKVRAKALGWYHRHPEKVLVLRAQKVERKRETSALWNKRNSARCCAKTQRREAAKLKAIPPWLTPLDGACIDLIYAVAAWKSLETGTPHQVDHIYPALGSKHT